MQISLEDAYAEATKVIGEQAVTIRFLTVDLARVQTERDALANRSRPSGPITPTPIISTP